MLAVRLDKEMEKKLEHLARETHRSKSFFVKEALGRYFAEKEGTLLALAQMESREPSPSAQTIWKVREEAPGAGAGVLAMPKGNPMYTAVIKKSGTWWIGWVEEIPGVNCQERTRAGLLASLRSALAEALEMNRNEAIAAAGETYREETIGL